MESLFFSCNRHRIHCLRFGTGAQLLIAFHGFGDQARLFAGLEAAFLQKYTVLSFDLPFHGQTSWEDESFTIQDILGMINWGLSREGVSYFSLMGFSFGARVALALLQSHDLPVENLYLLSPDGIQTTGLSPAYAIPYSFRRLIYNRLKNPGWLQHLARTGNRFGIVPAAVLQFVVRNTSRPERLRRAFHFWLSLNHFKVKPAVVGERLQQANIRTYIYYGVNDPLVKVSAIKKFARNRSCIRLTALAGGHRLDWTNIRLYA